MKIIFFWGLFSVFVILLIAQMITLIPILKKEIAIVFIHTDRNLEGEKWTRNKIKFYLT